MRGMGFLGNFLERERNGVSFFFQGFSFSAKRKKKLEPTQPLKAQEFRSRFPFGLLRAREQKATSVLRI